MLCDRWLGCREGREPLLAASYFILTALEAKLGRRHGVVKQLRVSEAVLDRLGYLVSEYGDGATARKARLYPLTLTAEHEQWIRVAVPELIRRLARPQDMVPNQQLTMADLPSLP